MKNQTQRRLDPRYRCHNANEALLAESMIALPECTIENENLERLQEAACFDPRFAQDSK